MYKLYLFLVAKLLNKSFCPSLKQFFFLYDNCTVNLLYDSLCPSMMCSTTYGCCHSCFQYDYINVYMHAMQHVFFNIIIIQVIIRCINHVTSTIIYNCTEAFFTDACKAKKSSIAYQNVFDTYIQAMNKYMHYQSNRKEIKEITRLTKVHFSGSPSLLEY